LGTRGNEWTVPFGLIVAKTTAIGKQIIKLNAGIEYNVVRSDNFASDWKFTFTFSPVGGHKRNVLAVLSALKDAPAAFEEMLDALETLIDK
jgi:hypothetical protein